MPPDALDQRRPLDDVPVSEDCPVVDADRNEAAVLEVGTPLAEQRVPAAAGGPALAPESRRGRAEREPDDPVKLDLRLVRLEQRSRPVDLAVALDEALEHALDRGGREHGPDRRRPRACGPAGESEHRRTARGRSPAAGTPSPIELLDDCAAREREAPAERLEVVSVVRGDDTSRQLLRVLDVAGQDPDRREDGGLGGHENGPRADVASVEDGVGRAGAAVGDDRALTWVVAPLDRRRADQVGHLGVDDPEDPDRDLLGLHPELRPPAARKRLGARAPGRASCGPRERNRCRGTRGRGRRQ